MFNRATLEVLLEAGIKTSVFNQSVELYMITSQDSLLQASKLSLFTPFALKDEVKDLDEDQSVDLLRQATDAAL